MCLAVIKMYFLNIFNRVCGNQNVYDHLPQELNRLQGSQNVYNLHSTGIPVVEMGLLNIYSLSMGYSKPVCRISTGSFHSTQNRHANLFRLSASFEVVETGLDSTYRLSTGFVLKTGLPNVYSFWGCQTGYNSSTDTSQGLQQSKLPCQTITSLQQAFW